jgi:hypothetical protein
MWLLCVYYALIIVFWWLNIYWKIWFIKDFIMFILSCQDVFTIKPYLIMLVGWYSCWGLLVWDQDICQVCRFFYSIQKKMLLEDIYMYDTGTLELNIGWSGLNIGRPKLNIGRLQLYIGNQKKDRMTRIWHMDTRIKH